MYQLEYIAKLQAPVLISNITDENTINTMDYLPGSSILGTFAAEYIRRKQPKDAHSDMGFYAWFLSGQLVFSNAYLSIPYAGKSLAGYPVPFYLQKEKGEGQEQLFNCFQGATSVKKTSSLAGYGRFENEVIIKEPKTKLHFHHARTDRLAGHSTDGLIFNYEALDPEQTFIGTIYGAEEDLIRFKEFFGTKLNTRIGRSRKAEYGATSIELGEISEIEYDESIFKKDGLSPNELYVTLISPCIIENEYGFADPSEKQFKRCFAEALGNSDFVIRNCMVKTTRIETYVSVWGMKRPSVTGLAAGSSFLIEFKDLTDKMRRRMAEMAQIGIGERRHEGFGQLRFNLATHKAYQKKDEVARENISKPNEPIPELFTRIFTDILEGELRRKAVTKALRDAERFSSPRPSNSLLGKLALMFSSVADEEICSKLDALKKPARSQLEQCDNGSATLWSFIRNRNSFSLESITSMLPDGWRELIDEIGIAPRASFMQELYKLFWQTFFHRMRTLNKEVSGEETSNA